MSWFRNRQDPPAPPENAEVAALRSEVAALASEVRALKLEWAEASDRLYRWMKRGEAAARRIEDAKGAEERAGVQQTLPEIPVDTPLPRRVLWGARARRAARQQAAPAMNGGGEEGE